jgi:hypothetical protein
MNARLPLGGMRTLLFILALAFGCAGCRERQTAPGRVQREHGESGGTYDTSDIGLAEQAERPPFYDSNNMAEH